MEKAAKKMDQLPTSRAPQASRLLLYQIVGLSIFVPVLLGMLVLVGMGIYWVCTDSGLYHWLKECELKLFKGYYPVTTGILTIVLPPGLLALPFLPLSSWWANRINQMRASEPAQQETGDRETGKVDMPSLRPEPDTPADRPRD